MKTNKISIICTWVVITLIQTAVIEASANIELIKGLCFINCIALGALMVALVKLNK